MLRVSIGLEDVEDLIEDLVGAASPAVMAAARAAVGATACRRAAGPGRRARCCGCSATRRTGLVLLLVARARRTRLAALLPDGPRLLDALALRAAARRLALSGVAAVAVRAPTAGASGGVPRRCRPGAGALEAAAARLTAPEPLDRGSGGPATAPGSTGSGRAATWAIHAVRRGWSRFAGLLSHLALVVIVLGAAIGAAFGSETVFSLLRGDQALLDAPRTGFASAVRLERLRCGVRRRRPAAGASTRRVTFLRDGEPVREAVLRVNEPGEFDGYLVHPWTYGPAVRLRVTTLGGIGRCSTRRCRSTACATVCRSVPPTCRRPA